MCKLAEVFQPSNRLEADLSFDSKGNSSALVSKLNPNVISCDQVSCKDLSIIVEDPLKRNKGLEICKSAGYSLTMFHVNIRSLRYKLQELEIVLDELKCNIISINEHWLMESELELYIPDGYKLLTYYCRPDSGYGGVAVYVSHSLETVALNISQFCETRQFEAAALKLTQLNVIFVSVYRTPDSDLSFFSEKLGELFDFFANHHKCTLIVSGDINLDVRRTDFKTLEFLNMLRSYDCYCLNDKPTRQVACLDNFISNINRESVISVELIETHLSDHQGLKLVVHFPQEENKQMKSITKCIRPLSDDCIARCKLRLSCVDWVNNFLHCTSLDETFDCFMYTLSDIFNDTCPVKTVKYATTQRKNSDKKWFNSDLRTLRAWVSLFFDLMKSNPEYRESYVKLKKLYRAEIRLAKIKENDNFILSSANKCKSAWKVINAETNRTSGQNKDIPIAPNDLNNFFVNVQDQLGIGLGSVAAVNPINLMDRSVPQDDVDNVFKWKPVSLLDVSNCVKKLSNSRSEDLYGFSNYVFKLLFDSIQEPLLYLFNCVLDEGVFPNCLKSSLTVPIYKKGDRQLCNSYRPVALPPIVSKILESVMKSQLENFFEANKFLSSAQFGFRNGLSTIKAVENVVNYVLDGFERGFHVSATLLDLSKAFDLIPHNTLIEKLFVYGVRGTELSLLESYLTDRWQMVKIGDQRSDPSRTRAGVPQGSVLGPFLFVIYMNDLPSYLSSDCVLYADDTTLLSSHKSTETLKQLMSEAVDGSNLWFEANNLVVNKDKTEEIVFSLSEGETKSVKLLGIYLDNKLSWENHTKSLCTRLSRVIFLLKKLKLCTSADLVIKAYFAFFHTHLLYGVTMWGNSPGAKVVFGWQKKAIRCIVGIKQSESCKPFFISLGIMTLSSLYILYSLLLVKDNLEKFHMRGDRHTHNTRSRHLIDADFVRLSKTQKSFLAMGIKLFNRLPAGAREVPRKKFKATIERWLLDLCPYSIQDFEESNLRAITFT
jgi:hypothetical protein